MHREQAGLDNKLNDWSKRKAKAEAKEKDEKSMQSQPRQKESAERGPTSPLRRGGKPLHLGNLNTDLDNGPEPPMSPTAKQMLDVNDAYRNGEISIEERGQLKRHIIGQALNINEHVKGGGKEYGANPMDEVMGGDDDDDDDDDDDELGDDDDDDDEGLGCDKVYNLRHS
jgi:hypothetical protein